MSPDNDWDQVLCWVYDETDKAGIDILKVPFKSYADDVEFPFPDIPLKNPGKYRIYMQFYVKMKGDTGGGEWSHSESGGGTWTFDPSEGQVSVAIAKGEFTFIVPEG